MAFFKQHVNFPHINGKKSDREKMPRLFEPEIHGLGNIGGDKSKPSTWEKRTSPFFLLNVQDVIRRGGVEGFHFFDGFIKTIGTRGFGSLEQQAVECGVKSRLHIFLNVIDAE